MIKYHLPKSCLSCLTGRPGPVWLDIPLDVQSKEVDLDELSSFIPDEPEEEDKNYQLKPKVAKCIDMLQSAKRPVLISGYGIRLSKAENEFRELIDKLKIPVISSWTTSDLIPTSHEHYVGRSGIMGDRAGNFAIQNADFLLIIGSRMSIPQVGYNYKTFAREAKKVMLDIDKAELKKPSIKPDLPIKADAKSL